MFMSVCITNWKQLCYMFVFMSVAYFLNGNSYAILKFYEFGVNKMTELYVCVSFTC